VRSADSLDVAGVPTLLEAPGRAGAAPLVVLWHPFGPLGREREALASALPLSGLSAWKAYPSLPLFGPRAPAGGFEELAERQREDYLLRLVAPVVEGAARELAPLVAELARQQPVDVTHGIGLVGCSGGAAAVLLSLFESDASVGAAVVLNGPASAMSGVAAVERVLGSPYAWSEQSRALASRLDFARRAEELARRPALPALLIVHGALDAVIPSADAVRLYDALAPCYAAAGAADRLELRILPELAHELPAPPALDDADDRAVPNPLDDVVADWLRRHLGTADSTRSGAPAT
jgi:predicted esterase